MTAQFQNLVQIIVIACLVVFGLGRIFILKIQNIKVLVLDPQITKTQRINGIFFVALDLLASGTFLLQGKLIFLILALCIVITLHVQILQEENFLIQAYGDDYKQYCSKVGRYYKF